MPDYTVIDSTRVLDGHYLRTVFRRNEPLKKKVSLLKWLWLTAVEIIFGKEILEHMIINASVDSKESHPTIKDHGKLMHLSRHIPAGIFPNLFRRYIIQVLYYKFFHQYGILWPEEPPQKNETNKTINCSHNRFCMDKQYLEQLISFRRAYDLSWLSLNLIFDLVAYLASSNLSFAMLTALTVEALRRLIKA